MAGNSLQQIAQSRRLIERLERLSADSYWAHQASGVRGALLRSLEGKFEQGKRGNEGDGQRSSGLGLDELMSRAYFILEQAARELERKV